MTDNTGDDVYFHYTKSSSTRLTISFAYKRSSTSFRDYNNPRKYGLNEDDLYNADYVLQMISATSISGYESKIEVDDESHIITITYFKPFTDGDLLFRPTSGNTVSVALNLTKSKQVTDTITRTGKLWDHTAIGATASTSDGSETYIYIGDRYDTNGVFQSTATEPHYSYARTHTVNYSDVTSVTIPATITNNGVTYEVTSIEDQGFIYGQAFQFERLYCGSDKDVDTKNCLTMEARND